MMYHFRFLLACAVLLSFSATINAAVAQRRVGRNSEDLSISSEPKDNGLFSAWSLRSFLQKRQEPEELICEDTPSWRTLDGGNREDTQIVCNKLIGPLPPATVEIESIPGDVTRTTTAIFTSTTTKITRTIITITEYIASSTPAVVPRAANAAQIAQDVFQSILLAQTNSSIAPATQTERDEVLQEMSTACSCLNVAPTSTVTVVFTAPPGRTTVRQARQRLATEWITKSYTSIVTAVSSLAGDQTLNSTAGLTSSLSSMEPLSTIVLTNRSASDGEASTEAPFTTSVSDESSTGTLGTTITTDAGVIPLPTNTGTSGPVVLALPFSCPEDNGKRITNIAGNKRYEYQVLCDTAAVGSEPLLADEVSDPTECAAECSVINDKFQRDECEVAVFTEIPGAGRGLCTFTGATTNFVASPGSVTLVHTATIGTGDAFGNCAVDLIDGTPTASIDTTSLLASISSASISVSTPGFVTGGGDGGEFRTSFSTGATGTDGVYRYSFYELYESSSFWYKIYATSWSCTNNIPRTIVVQAPTSTGLAITSVLNSDAVTVVSGNYTSFYTQGSGAVTPTSVAAETTSGGGVFSTGFSEATRTSTGGEGAQTPSATSEVIVSNGTSTGADQLTVSSATVISNGTTGFGSILPSSSVPALVVSSEGSAVFTVSDATAVSNFTFGSGAVTPSPSVVSSEGSAVFTISDATVVSNFTFGSGAVTPSPSIISSEGSAVFTVSDATAVSNFTFGSGAVTPSPSIISSEGSAVFTVSDATAVSNFTFGSGAVTPSPSVISSEGSAVFTISDATAVSNITFGSGASTPAPSDFVVSSEGSAVFTVSDATAVLNFTFGSGAVTPVPSSSVVSSDGSAVFTTSDATAVSNATFGGGASTPSPSSNQTVIESTPPIVGTATFSTGGNDSSIFSTGGVGSDVSTTVSVTVTSQITVSVTSVQTSNGSFAGTLTGVVSTANSTGGSGFIVPTASELTSSGALNFSISGGTTVSSFVQGSGAITPTPSANASSTVTDDFDFNNSGDNRSGRFSRTSRFNSTFAGTGEISPSTAVPEVNSTISGTAPTGTAPITTAGSNSTAMSSATGSSESQDYPPQPSSSLPSPPGNSTSILPTDQPSVTLPPSSANITSSGAATESTDNFDFSNSEGGRIGSFSRTSSPSGTLPSVTANFSLPLSSLQANTTTYLFPTGGSSVPVVTANSSLTVETASSATPPPSFNASLPFPTGGTASIGFSSLAANSSVLVGTGSISVPTASFNLTIPLSTGASTLVPPLSLNSTAPPSLLTATPSSEACPTATEFSVSLETVTTVIIISHTVPLGPSTCISSGVLAPTANATLITDSILVPTYTTTSTGTLASASASLSQFRRAGTLATPDQIAAACASTSNLVFNPDFELEDDDNAFGWTTRPDDSFISFRTIPSDTQHTPGGRRSGRVLSAAAGRSIVVSTPLTLCPGVQYQLSAFNRQSNLLAQCEMRYSIGDREVFPVGPQEVWLARSGFYTAGETPEDVSVDLNIRVTCAGQGGMLGGTNDTGYMEAEIDDVALVAV